MNILIIEDTYFHQKILVHLFEMFNDIRIDSFIRENGQEALEFIKSNKFDIDLIFTDVKMPIMDGVKFCEEFRKIDVETPIVVMTCNYELHNRDTMKTATHFIKKPVDFKMVKEIVYYYNRNIDQSKNRKVYL